MIKYKSDIGDFSQQIRNFIDSHLNESVYSDITDVLVKINEYMTLEDAFHLTIAVRDIKSINFDSFIASNIEFQPELLISLLIQIISMNVDKMLSYSACSSLLHMFRYVQQESIQNYIYPEFIQELVILISDTESFNFSKVPNLIGHMAAASQDIRNFILEYFSLSDFLEKFKDMNEDYYDSFFDLIGDLSFYPFSDEISIELVNFLCSTTDKIDHKYYHQIFKILSYICKESYQARNQIISIEFYKKIPEMITCLKHKEDLPSSNAIKHVILICMQLFEIDQTILPFDAFALTQMLNTNNSVDVIPYISMIIKNIHDLYGEFQTAGILLHLKKSLSFGSVKTKVQALYLLNDLINLATTKEIDSMIQMYYIYFLFSIYDLEDCELMALSLNIIAQLMSYSQALGQPTLFLMYDQINRINGFEKIDELESMEFEEGSDIPTFVFLIKECKKTLDSSISGQKEFMILNEEDLDSSDFELNSNDKFEEEEEELKRRRRTYFAHQNINE